MDGMAGGAGGGAQAAGTAADQAVPPRQVSAVTACGASHIAYASCVLDARNLFRYWQSLHCFSVSQVEHV